MQLLSRADLDPSLVFVAFLSLFAALLTLRAVPALHRIARPVSEEGMELVGTPLAALVATVLVMGELTATLPVFLLSMLGAAVLRNVVNRLSMPGILWLTGIGAGFLLTTLWSTLFILEAEPPAALRVVMLIGLGLAALLFLATQVAGLSREAVLTHERWQRPTAAPVAPRAVPPLKVSLQLPCYAEPPEVVIETMNRLAALDYADYEVLVCDNNTKDERLWRPLEAHCALLNRRLGREIFRFFHVAPLEGAKAGALNWLLDRMDPGAALIGVIDADYLARSDFLARLVPFFADPKLGYIQTPHDYRGFSDSSYLTACHWEYMPANKVDYPGYSEYGGGFTIGTMCLLRTQALRAAGGWAEWCLTEDSEVSVRIRAAGYEGLYLAETFGRGLIPETFDDYKKQRFRWTAGPVQQLRRHWRLFLPQPFAPAMPGWTKLLEVVRCIAPLQTLATLAFGLASLVGMIVALSLGVMHPMRVPPIAGLLLALGGATWWVRTMHRYRLSGCFSTEDMIRGEIARASLSWVVLVAGLAGLSKRPLAWRRTPKFAGMTAEDSPFASTMPETIAGTVTLLMALMCLSASDLIGDGVALLGFLGLSGLSAQFFCAPLMAAMAIRDASPDRRAARRPLPFPTMPEAGQPVPVLALQDVGPGPARRAPQAVRP